MAVTNSPAPTVVGMKPIGLGIDQGLGKKGSPISFWNAAVSAMTGPATTPYQPAQDQRRLRNRPDGKR